MTLSNVNMNQQSNNIFKLVVRQQPCKARLCSFKEKVDRRPIDPPPIIQLQFSTLHHNPQQENEYLQNPYFFLYATLTDASGESDLHFVNGNRTTAGTVVQSLHKLKDIDNSDGGFFIFSDISIRLEGFYRLKFTLYEIDGSFVKRKCHTLSDVFQVYSPKSFPGMSESTFLTRSFSDQGVRIRIRKEPRSSSSSINHQSTHNKRRRISNDDDDDDDGNDVDDDNDSNTSMPRSYYNIQLQQDNTKTSSSSPLPPSTKSKLSMDDRPTLPSPKEIFRSSPMSMQNLLSSSDEIFNTRKLPSLPDKTSPSPSPPHIYHSSFISTSFTGTWSTPHYISSSTTPYDSNAKPHQSSSTSTNSSPFYYHRDNR